MKSSKNGQSGKPAGDPLAVERTAMASERTLLSYIRTAIMLLATGVTLMYLAKDIRVVALGTVILGSAGFTAAFGAWRYRSLQKKIAEEAHLQSPDE